MARIRITDREIDASSTSSARRPARRPQYNIAQILVTVPEGASEADGRRAPRARRGGAGPRAGRRAVRAGGARSVGRRQPGQAAARSACARPTACPTCSSRWCARSRRAQVAPTLLRSGAGFHVLKLVDRRDAGAFTITQTRARHILLRASPQLTQEAATAPAGRSEAPDRGRHAQLRAGGARQLRGRQRGAGRRPRLGLAGHLRARVRAGDEPAADRRHVRPVRVALRRAPGAGRRTGATSTLDLKQQREQARNVLREQQLRRGLRRVGARPARARLRRDARAAVLSRASDDAAAHEAHRAQALRPALPDRRSRDRRRSSMRSIRSPATRWSRSAPASAR